MFGLLVLTIVSKPKDKGNWLNENGCLDGWMEHPKSSMICGKFIFFFFGGRDQKPTTPNQVRLEKWSSVYFRVIHSTTY